MTRNKTATRPMMFLIMFDMFPYLPDRIRFREAKTRSSSTSGRKCASIQLTTNKIRWDHTEKFELRTRDTVLADEMSSTSSRPGGLNLGLKSGCTVLTTVYSYATLVISKTLQGVKRCQRVNPNGSMADEILCGWLRHMLDPLGFRFDAKAAIMINCKYSATSKYGTPTILRNWAK